MVQEVDPLPPRLLNDAIPADPETICLKCLQKSPGARIATAGELADDLRRFLKGRPIAARPVGRGEKLWRWCRRKPGLAAALAGFVVLASSVVVLAVVFAVIRKDLRAKADASAEAYRQAALDARRASDLARNMAIAGTRSRLEAIKNIRNARDADALKAVPEKTRAECDETVRQYASRAALSSVTGADMAEAQLRDAIELRTVDYDDLADSMFDDLIARGRALPRDYADYARIRRATIRSAIARALFHRAEGKPLEAIELLTSIRNDFPFDRNYGDANRSELRDHFSLLDNLIASYGVCPTHRTFATGASCARN